MFCVWSVVGAQVADQESAWPVDRVRELLRDYHVNHQDMTNLPSSGLAVLSRLEQLDPAAAMIERKDSSDPIGGTRLGAVLIDGRDARVLVPLLGGAVRRSGISRVVRLFDADLLEQGLIVGTYLDNEAFVFQKVTADAAYSRSVSSRKTDLGTVVSIHGFVAGETLNSLRHELDRLDGVRGGEALHRGSRDASSFILDLRYCAGGDVYEAADAATIWFNRKVDWVNISRENRTSIDLQAGFDGNRTYKVPMALLVSRFTASACEQLVQGLRHHLGVVLIGESTAGKCSVQSTFRLNQAYAIRFTTGRWQGPGDRPCRESGIPPDIAIVGNVHSDEAVAEALSR